MIGRSALQSLGPLRLVDHAPDTRTPIAKVRDLIAAQKQSGALGIAEAAGAEWALDTLEALTTIEAKADDDHFHEQTFGSVRGG